LEDAMKLFRHLGLALLALPLSLAAGKIDVTTAASEVTVYPQGARVLRTGKAEAGAGEQTLVLAGLPGGLREDSLRVSVQGPAGTRVLGLRLRPAFSDKDTEARRQALQDQIQGVQDAKDDSQDRANAKQAELEILRAVAGKEAKAFGAGSLAGLETGAAGLGKRIAALNAGIRAETREQRKLDAKIKALQDELNSQGPGGTMTRVAEADLDLSGAGEVAVELTYFSDQAGWSPRYDLRLKAADEKPTAELDFLAELRQASGEDWKGVKLALSTARPTVDSQVPDPSNWWLDYAYERRFMLKSAARGAMPMAEAAGAAAPPPGDAAEKDALETASYANAQTQDLGPATLFTVGHRQDIPSDNQAHRVAISSGTHPAELSLVVVPRLSPAGYIEAKIQYKGEQPLLAGPVQLFRDSDLAGQAYLSYTAPGETLTLGFGQDERIKAERVRQKQSSGGGWTGKDHVQYAWAIKVSNFHQGPRTVEVREQLPRSRQDAIKVTALQVEPKAEPEDPAKPGLLTWKLDLKAGQSQTLKLGYEVKWPEDKRVTGLE
jgi:uncharacterized protein (TIGR02231 family)